MTQGNGLSFEPSLSVICITIKVLNFRTPKILLQSPKIQTKRPNLKVFCLKHANGIANSEDPDQTAPLGAA